MPVKLHPPQEEAVAKMHNGCILYGDVGVGKTITSLAYYFERVCGGILNKWGSMTTPKDVYVITTAKVRDSKAFELQAAGMGVHVNPELSTNGVRITVDSWNNLHKYVEVEDAFFIFDEQRVVGYGAWSRAFIKVAKSNEWILLSATPGDTWLDYIPVFIANGWYKHKTDFIDQHVIWTPRVKYPKVMRYQNVGTLVRRRNEVLVRMPYERHTKRHPVDVVCDYDEDLFEKAVKKRWHVYENRPLRDVSELFGVMRKVVNTDSSRLRAVQDLLGKHPRLIVFYNFDYELEMLRTLIPEDQLASPESIKQLKQKLDSRPNLSEDGQTQSPSGKPKTKSQSSGHHPSSSGSTVRKTAPLEDAGSASANGERFSTTSGEKSIGGSSEIPEASSQTSTSSGHTTTTSTSKSSEDLKRLSKTTATDDLDAPTQDLVQASGDASGTVRPGFAIAEWNGHKHEEIPATERWLYLVQYRAGAEGWNCIETDAIVFYSQTYSYRDWHQAHGRIDRINTPFTDLYYYHLISKSVIDKAIRAALRVKKNFNERDLKLGEAA